MHGLQYSVIVYWYLRRQTQAGPLENRFVARLVQPGHVAAFVFLGLVYSAAFHALSGGPIGEFLFGWVHYPTLYQAIPALGLSEMSPGEGYAVVSLALADALALTHYYFDSFIWKVSDRRIQRGLA
jgi:hypothetical protein